MCKTIMSIEIIAPMPGKIASIPVSVGSQVKEEEEAIISSIIFKILDI